MNFGFRARNVTGTFEKQAPGLVKFVVDQFILFCATSVIANKLCLKNSVIILEENTQESMVSLHLFWPKFTPNLNVSAIMSRFTSDLFEDLQ